MTFAKKIILVVQDKITEFHLPLAGLYISTSSTLISV